MLEFGLGIPSVRRKLLVCSTLNLQLCLLFVLKASKEILKEVSVDYCALVLNCLEIDIGTMFKYLYMPEMLYTKYLPSVFFYYQTLKSTNYFTKLSYLGSPEGIKNRMDIEKKK